MIIFVHWKLVKSIYIIIPKTRKIEDGTFSQRGRICEKIASNKSNPVSKTPYKRPQENQRERGIPNKIGNNRKNIYRDVLQDWLSWDKEVPGQGKSELFMRFHFPGLRPEGKTWRIRGKYRRGNNRISGYDQHLTIH